MTQKWDPQDYERNGAFVHGLADGLVKSLAADFVEIILDLGCGNGQLTQKMVATGANIIGIDASPEMVEAACARGVKAQVATADHIPFPDRHFDAVFSNAVLHWINDQDAMLAEVKRVLRKGGRFVAEMGGLGNVAAIRVALAAVLARHGCSDLDTHEGYFPTPEGYSMKLSSHGFKVEEMELYPRPTVLPESGMEGWLQTFRRGVLDALPEEIRQTVIDETVALLEPVLCDENGEWTADYVRLRFIARA